MEVKIMDEMPTLFQGNSMKREKKINQSCTSRLPYLSPNRGEKLDLHYLIQKSIAAKLAKTSEFQGIKYVTNCDDLRSCSEKLSIHKLALEGNWQAAKGMIDKENKLINASITTFGFTLLHIAAGANQIEFVKLQILWWMIKGFISAPARSLFQPVGLFRSSDVSFTNPTALAS
ncbi:unnamed protein product [Vicia faba]|uniref:Uncharacterized protein n=1 Tax=Vicia faba TaxID=3906 RepID=A0AAV0YQE8_VICFA|nr:unnamed protein product [Vicia faba]